MVGPSVRAVDYSSRRSAALAAVAPIESAAEVSRSAPSA